MARVRVSLGPRPCSAGSATGRPALFVGFTATMAECDFSRPFIAGYGSSPSRRGPVQPKAARSGLRSPRFRRDPFVRDRVSDLGRAPAPRIAAPDVLPSTLRTVSASAVSPFRGSIAYPTQLLCTLRRGRHLPRRNTRYQAGATPYLHRSSTGWIAPASPGAHVTEVKPCPEANNPKVNTPASRTRRSAAASAEGSTG